MFSRDTSEFSPASLPAHGSNRFQGVTSCGPVTQATGAEWAGSGPVECTEREILHGERRTRVITLRNKSNTLKYENQAERWTTLGVKTFFCHSDVWRLTWSGKRERLLARWVQRHSFFLHTKVKELYLTHKQTKTKRSEVSVEATALLKQTKSNTAIKIAELS